MPHSKNKMVFKGGGKISINTCMKCGFESSSQIAIRLHMKKAHELQNPKTQIITNTEYNCVTCKKTFFSKSELGKHYFNELKCSGHN